MSCSNCYNGCAEIVSDKCVKYTGVDVPILGIKTGDSLSYIEQSLIEFLTSTLNGEGILPVIDQTALCAIVSGNLPTCGDITLNDYINALIKTACALKVEITGLGDAIAVIEANYDVDCLEGVTPTSGTHDILQAVITKLCALGVDVAALAVDVDANYVKLADFDSLVAAYLASLPSSDQQYKKMVPYSVMEYYGSLSYFDGTGKGIALLGWDKVYLCNGQNGTPDKRGRVGVGAIVGVGGGVLDPAVDPATSGNPNYGIGDTTGVNFITLNASQIPAHTHVATVTDNHYHHVIGDDTSAATCSTPTGSAPVSSNGNCGTNPAYSLSQSAQSNATLGKSSGTQGTISVSNSSIGGGLSHGNIQPVLACYYIMYIP